MAAQIARELAEQGFHSQTIAATGKPEEDLKIVAAIREMVGDRIELRFDGLGRYDPETARDLAAGLEPHELQFFLDPLETRELHPVASLGRQTSVPLAVWRAIHGPADVLTAVRCNAAAFVMVDLEQVGGIVPARACAAIAAAGGVTAGARRPPFAGDCHGRHAPRGGRHGRLLHQQRTGRPPAPRHGARRSPGNHRRHDQRAAVARPGRDGGSGEGGEVSGGIVHR